MIGSSAGTGGKDWNEGNGGNGGVNGCAGGIIGLGTSHISGPSLGSDISREGEVEPPGT